MITVLIPRPNKMMELPKVQCKHDEGNGDIMLYLNWPDGRLEIVYFRDGNYNGLQRDHKKVIPETPDN